MSVRHMRRRDGRFVAIALLIAGIVGAGGVSSVAAAAPRIPAPTTTVRAVLHAFNTADCYQIYALTAPWKRPQPQDAGITACQQGFADGFQNGVTTLHLTLGGRGRYLGPGDDTYRQPLRLRRVLDGRTDMARETLQLVSWRGRWYVLALW